MPVILITPVKTINYSTLIPADEPVGYWRLGESSGTTAFTEVNSPTLNGSHFGSITHGVSGALVGDSDTAYSLIGGYINVNPNALINTPGSAITVECWFKFTASTTNRPLIAKWGGDESYIMLVPGAPGKIRFSIRISDINYTADSNTTLNDGVWHHAVGRYSSTDSEVSLYIDGIKQTDTDSITGSVDSTTDSLKFGHYSDLNGPGPFVGDLDEIAIYHTALSPATILAHYNAGAGT